MRNKSSNKIIEIIDSLPTTSGIYKITCLSNGKYYYGQTYDIKRRCTQHFSLLRRDLHRNPILQNCFNKYGEENFDFGIIKKCEISQLDIEEQIFLTNSANDPLCINIAKFATSNRRGTKHTPEAIEKMKVAKTGLKASEETRKKLSETHSGVNHYLYGKNLSQDRVDKLVESHLKDYIFISPDGVETKIRNLREFCRQNDLNQGHMVKVSKGKAKQHKSWTLPK